MSICEYMCLYVSICEYKLLTRQHHDVEQHPWPPLQHTIQLLTYLMDLFVHKTDGYYPRFTCVKLTACSKYLITQVIEHLTVRNSV